MEREINILLQSKALKASHPQSRLRPRPHAVLQLWDGSVSLWLSCAASGGGGLGSFFFFRLFYVLTSLPMRLMTYRFCKDLKTGLYESFFPQCSMQMWSFTLHCSRWVHAWCWTAQRGLTNPWPGTAEPTPGSGRVAEPHTCRSCCQAERYFTCSVPDIHRNQF